MDKKEQHNTLEELIEMLKRLASEKSESKAITITMEDIEFDEQGKVIIKNHEIAKTLKKLIEENEKIYLSKDLHANAGCIVVNIPC